MMNCPELDQLICELIEHPSRRTLLLQCANLDADQLDYVNGLLATADSLWLTTQEAPPLENDPVAALLGLIPDGECQLSPTALKRARKRAKQTVSDVATALNQRGWTYAKHDVFRWETKSTADVPPAVVQAIAEILHAPVGELVSAPAERIDGLESLRAHPIFQTLVSRWAQARNVSQSVAESMLQSRALATVHRGEQPTVDQLLRSLETLVTSVEEASKGD